jgi:hypothetical protein
MRQAARAGVLDSASVRWAAAEGVSETIAVVLLLEVEERRRDREPKLRLGELEQVIKLVGRSPSCYPPLVLVLHRRAAISRSAVKILFPS